MKKFFFFLVMLLLLCFNAQGEYFVIGDFSFNGYDDVKTCVLNNYSGSDSEIEIPESVTYNDVSYTVTEIGFRAFFNNDDLKKVSLPNSIVKINDSGFAQCHNLENLNFPSELTYIDNSAFRYCTKMKSVPLPDKLEYIGNESFAMCYEFNSLDIPKSVTHIGSQNFNWSYLKHVSFLDGEETIEIAEDAFGVLNLSEIYIGRNIIGSKLPLAGNILNSIYVGKYVSDLVWFNPSEYTSMYQISLQCEEPPVIGRFSDSQYNELLIYVPTEAISSYQNNQTWAFFENIIGLDLPLNDYDIQITPEQATIEVGNLLEIDYSLNPWIYSYVTMAVSDYSTISMPEFGKIYGQAPGEAEVTLTLLLNGKTSTCKVTVIQPATKVTLNKTALNLEVGETTKIFANVSPENVSDATVTWTSSNPDVATVEDGNIYAVGGGDCEIVATAHNGISASCKVHVTSKPTGISISENILDIAVGEQIDLIATIDPSNANGYTISWSSSDDKIVFVNNKGRIKGLSPGAATITASTDNGLSASCEVTVKEILPASISLNAEYASITVGETYQLEATVSPENASDKTVTWTSSDANVATVEDGLVKAVGPGIVTIAATTANSLTATCEVTVIQPATGIVLNAEYASMNVGETYQLEATVSPENVSDKSITWTTSDENVATVENGLVKAVGPGVTTITATTANGFIATCQMTVILPVTGIEISAFALDVEVGEEIKLYASVVPDNASDQSVAWSSSNLNVATVEDGLVTAVGPGIATITATTTNGLTATCEITVTQPVNAITLNAEYISINVGESYRLEATLSPENASDKSVNWDSSDANVATIENGLVTAVGPGVATITATTANGLAATCEVTVIQPVEGIELSATELAAEVGDAIQLYATVLPENASDKTVIWHSDNTEVATVSETGLVKIVGIGHAVISAQAGEYSAQCVINAEAGIDAILDSDTEWKVYNLNGVVVREKATKEELGKLVKDIYIITDGHRIFKLQLGK